MHAQVLSQGEIKGKQSVFWSVSIGRKAYPVLPLLQQPLDQVRPLDIHLDPPLQLLHHPIIVLTPIPVDYLHDPHEQSFETHVLDSVDDPKEPNGAIDSRHPGVVTPSFERSKRLAKHKVTNDVEGRPVVPRDHVQLLLGWQPRIRVYTIAVHAVLA